MAQPTFGLTIKQVDHEPRPAVAADLSTIGLVVTAPGADAKNAGVSFGLADDNTGLRVSAKTAGAAGNALRLVITKPDRANARLTVAVADNTISVALATDADRAATTTAAQLKAGIEGKAGANALVAVAHITNSDGSGVIAAGELQLTGGADTRYPLKTPVMINSSDSKAVEALGTAGTIANQIDLIEAQLSGFAVSARIVIVRVAEGNDDNATMANLIEGIEALERAESILGVAPRLIAVPGYTHQQTTPATANPVVAALPGTLEKLVGMAVITGPHNSLQGYTDWRETFSSQRLIPVETWVKVGVEETLTDSACAVLGMIVARDNNNNGVPSKSAANRPMQGVVDVNRPIPFSTVDGNTEGQQILALNGGIIVRGEAGSVTSLGTGGFTFVGTDTAAEDDLWRFYNVKRMRDYIHLMFIRTLRIYLGRFNLTGQTVEAILNTMKIALRDLEADQDILGFRVGFDPDKNSPENLRLGRVTVNFKAEEPPVLRRLDIESYRYRPALDALLEDIQALAVA